LCAALQPENESAMPYPPPSHTGKRYSAKGPDGSRFHFTITDEIHMEQTGKPDKLIYLQQLKCDDGRVELRLGYFVIGKKPAMRGHWVWGQFATMIPVADFKRIISSAAQKGWLDQQTVDCGEF
jgi:hypothetical protein